MGSFLDAFGLGRPSYVLRDVKIDSSILSWYRNDVNNIFTIRDYGSNMYELDKKCGYFIKKSDCEIQ